MAKHQISGKINKRTKKFNVKPQIENISENFFIKPNDKIDKLQKNSKAYSKIRESESLDAIPESKKPFDKKTYRLKKYSKKYKIQQWEDKKKKAVLREYYKSIKNDPKVDVKRIYEESAEDELQDVGTQANSESKHHKPFKKAQMEFLRIKEEKQKAKEEYLRQKAEKEEARKKYKKEKTEKFKKLSKKTKKGQPIMKDRIEMLLEKIQKNME